MRVLIVEDERRLAENIARSLRESAGYAVDVALDGEEGLLHGAVEPVRSGDPRPDAAASSMGSRC